MKGKCAIRCAICCLLLFAPQDGIARVRLPRLIASGMVLQRNTSVRMWGWASPGERVTVRFLGRARSATTMPDSGWETVLPPMKPGGPFSMEIDAENHIVLNDILIGDVWVCSGQSNMELPMERVKPRYEEVIARSENSEIRQFIVPHKYDFRAPQSDMSYAQWEPANPWTVLHYTATGYFFARSLWEQYHVPIGLINASVGGTPIQSWMSRDALAGYPGLLAMAEKFADERHIDSVRMDNDAITGPWYSRLWQLDKGLNGENPWFDTSFDASAWQTMRLPAFWTDEGLEGVHGVVWFRKEFTVPRSLAGKPALLLMGRIVDADYEYLNGVFVGSVSYQYPPRRYSVGPGILKAGKNVLVIRVINSGGRGGFIKDKPYELIAGKDTVHLAGTWQYAVGVTADPMHWTTTIDYEPLGFFNGMIAPLLKFTIKGAIWYQGEANGGRPSGYGEMLAGMIGDWRKKWDEGDFPFLYVQLPNYGEPATGPTESGWAGIREDQLRTLAVPNTGMAVTIDIGEWNDLHPLNKSEVGRRLALAAEKVAYGDQRVVSSGPIYSSMKIEGDKIVIGFTDIGSGLKAKGGALRQFEIRGSDGPFVTANAKISGRTVIVWSNKVPRPVAVRYAWADNPAGANLYNKEGLPASPFETNP